MLLVDWFLWDIGSMWPFNFYMLICDLQKHVGERHLSVFQVQKKIPVYALIILKLQLALRWECWVWATHSSVLVKVVSTVRKVHPADLSRSDRFLHLQCCRQCRTAIRSLLLSVIVTASLQHSCEPFESVYISGLTGPERPLCNDAIVLRRMSCCTFCRTCH